MADFIKDGTGKGYLAKVNSDKEIAVRANSSPEESIISREKGDAYFANTTDTADTLTMTATGGVMLYLQNTSRTKTMVLEKILTSATTAGGVVKWTKNMTVTTITNHNTHVPVNLNFKSGNTADATCYSWNETGDGMTTFTVGTVIKTFITGAGFTAHPIDGAIILGFNDSITINYKPVSGTPEFECGIRFHYIED